MTTARQIGVYPLLLGVLVGYGAEARGVPWILYGDTESDSICDVVNTENAELVVLESTGQLVYVTEFDWVLFETFVDEEGFVFFDGFPAGFIEFATDGDGFRTLWWFYSIDDVADVNTVTGQPTPTGLTPAVFFNVPCDACEFWDILSDCADLDFDGVADRFDVCPFTPIHEMADVDGCSCSQLDTDLDEINDCFDLCPLTPLDELADLDGCSCGQVDSDLDGFDDCVDLCPGTPPGAIVDAFGCSCTLFDSDLDGINDCFDLCPATLLFELADVDGCSCSQLDSDLDGINDCFDFCPATAPFELADIDGCSCSQLDSDLDGIDDCDDLCPGTPLLTVVDSAGCAIGGSSGGGTVINVCGAAGAMIFPLMLLGLVGLRLHSYRPLKKCSVAPRDRKSVV